MSATPHPPLLARVPWTTLAWCAAVALPIVLLLAWPGVRTDRPAWLLLTVLLMTVPAGLLRRLPLPAFAVMLAISVTASAAVHVWEVKYLPILAGDLAVGYIAAIHRRLTSIIATAMALVAQIGAAVLLRDGAQTVPAIAVMVLALGVAWMIGNSLRERRIYADSLRAQAATQAVTAERLRIARELHDVIAHSIAIIAIQAGVGARVIDTQPGEARNALDTIETTSRETLAALRRTLGGLRHTGPNDEAASLDPAPGLADVDRLAASMADAGLRVDVHWLGHRRSMPADIDLSAYRIIQEALTNVVRHADTDACRVTIDYLGDELSINVTDDGPGGAVAGTGFGIIGMRERAGLLGGQLVAEPGPDRGFRVAVRLPLPAGVR